MSIYSNAIRSWIAENQAAARINEAYMSAVNEAKRGFRTQQGLSEVDRYSGMVGIQFDEYPFPLNTDIHWPRIEDFAGKLEEPQPTPEPQPALPFEVFHTVKFNESAAWEAVVALSRGC